MGEKYFCEMEGYTDCFVEVTDKWTMKELREMVDGDEKTYFSYINSKVEAMLLRDTTGKEFTNPKEFTADDVGEFDVFVAGFIGSVLPLHVRKRKSLGGMSVRTLQAGSGGVEQAKKN